MLDASSFIYDSQQKTKVWSNISFTIPLYIAYYSQFFLYAVIILGVLLTSTIYHHYKEQRFAVINKFAAYGLIGYNLYTLSLVGFRQPYFAIALIFTVIGLYFFFIKKKDDYGWHISSAVITTFCLLSNVL